jgi:hypothetical protein
MREEVRKMQRSIPCRRAVTALLAALVVTIAATPVTAADGSATNPAQLRHMCPPIC